MTVSYAYGYFACSLCTMFKPSACRDRRGLWLLSIQEKKIALKKTRNLALCKRGEMELNRRLSTEGIQM